MTNDTSGGHWIPLEPATGEYHRCHGSGTFTLGTVTQATSRLTGNWDGLIGGWAPHDYGEPYTFPTKCWECFDEPVFAHSNGCGDFVLLDPPLGPPWKVHTCYLQRNWKKLKIGELIQNGQLQLSGQAMLGSRLLHPDMGYITSRYPSSASSQTYIDICEVEGNLGRRSVEIDYWRRWSRAGRMVWILRNELNELQLVPVRFRQDDAATLALGKLITETTYITFPTTKTDCYKVKGTIIGVERLPSFIVGDYSRPRPTILGSFKHSLLWVLDPRRALIPVYVKWPCSDVEMGNVQIAGEWKTIGTLRVVFCTER